MPVEDPASNVYGSELRDEDEEYEYEEVEEEIEVEEEVEVEDEEGEIEEEELEEVDDDDENGDLIEDSADDVNQIDHQSDDNSEAEEREEGHEADGSEEELEECEQLGHKEENGDLMEASVQMDHGNAEEEGEELEKVDNENKKGYFIKELNPLKDIDDQNVEVEEEEEVEMVEVEEVDEDEDDDDETEEEVEVEEEEEVEMEMEVEVEAEEGDGDDNNEELIKDLTQLDQDASQILERHEPAEYFGLSSGFLRNSAADEKAVESCAGNYGNSVLVAAREKEDPQLHGLVIVEDLGCGAPLDKNWKTSENNGVFGELNSRTSTIDASSKVANNDFLCEKEPNQTTGEDPKQVAPRARLRSSTPDEYSDGSKRQAVLCDFYSKGWCIKGNLCGFLHVRDHAIIYQPSEGIIHVAEKKNELLDDEVSSIDKNQHRGRESPKEKSEMQVSLDRDGSPMEICKSSLKREFEKEDECKHDALPVDKGSLFDGKYSSCSLKSIEVSGSRMFSSDMRYLEDMTCKRGYMPDGQNSSASNSPSYKQPLPFGYSSGYTDALSSQKLCDGHKENHVSISNSFKQSPPFLEFDGPSKSYRLVDSQRLAELRSKMRYDWVPSVPFRPSFFITQRLLSSLNLYDPIRDSIEQTGSDSILGTKVCKKADLVQEGMSELDCNSSKYPISDQNSDGKIATKQIPEKNEFVLDGKGMDSVENTQWQDTYTSKGGKLLNFDFSEVSEDYKMNDDRRQGEGFRYNAEAKRKKGERLKEADADLRVDGGSVFKESREFKYFHSGLVEFVKELLRPMWHGGHLNKDAYKIIVKKVVEKVMVTLQPHQIPSTSESVEHYLASSQSKLTKLVEGYVNKHRKS